MELILLSSGNHFGVQPPDPQNIDIGSTGEITNSNGTTSLDMLNRTIDAIVTTGTTSALDWGIKAITLIFIASVLLMIMAIIFKHGQWQKFAQSTMLWSFISMIFIRAIPITILSFRSGMDVDQAFNTAIVALTQVALFLGVTGILLSFLFKFSYKLIQHPEYHRWSKNVLSISVLMMFFAIVGPYLFGIL